MIDLDRYVDPENYDFWDSWFNMLMVPKDEKMEDVHNALKTYVISVRVYHLKNEHPKCLEFRNNPRSSPLVVFPLSVILYPLICKMLGTQPVPNIGSTLKWLRDEGLCDGFTSSQV